MIDALCRRAPEVTSARRVGEAHGIWLVGGHGGRCSRGSGFYNNFRTVNAAAVSDHKARDLCYSAAEVSM